MSREPALFTRLELGNYGAIYKCSLDNKPYIVYSTKDGFIPGDTRPGILLPRLIAALNRNNKETGVLFPPTVIHATW